MLVVVVAVSFLVSRPVKEFNPFGGFLMLAWLCLEAGGMLALVLLLLLLVDVVVLSLGAITSCGM